MHSVQSAVCLRPMVLSQAQVSEPEPDASRVYTTLLHQFWERVIFRLQWRLLQVQCSLLMLVRDPKVWEHAAS